MPPFWQRPSTGSFSGLRSCRRSSGSLTLPSGECGRVLRGRQISGNAVFRLSEYDDLIEVVIAAGIELQGLVHCAVFLLDCAVVGHHVQGKLALLRVDLLQL